MDASWSSAPRKGLLAAVVLTALGLRAYPLHVFYLHPDQETVPAMAMTSLLHGNWRPESLVYPSGLMYILRAVYSAAYSLGHLLGYFPTREAFAARFVDEPFPFLLPARVWSCALGAGTVALVVSLGTRMFDRRTGLIAGFFLAVAFLHVRESHYGSLDAPATFFMTAALLAALSLQSTGRLRDAAGFGVLTSLATAFRYQGAMVALALPVVELLRTPRCMRAAMRRTAVAAAAALVTFAALNPYVFLEPARTYTDLHRQLARSYGATGLPHSPSLPLLVLLCVGAGSAMCAAAAVGVVSALRHEPRASLPCLVLIALYAAPLLRADLLFARYTLPLLPPIAVFAARGIETMRSLLPGRVARAGAALLVAAVAADPGLRSLALDRLLAREDTRLAARRWMRAHAPAGDWVTLVSGPVLIGPYGFEYVLPLPIFQGSRTLTLGMAVPHGKPAYTVTAWRPSQASPVPPRGVRYAISSDHPGLPSSASLQPEEAGFLRKGAALRAEFRAFPDQVPSRTLFEPIDANYVPLRGLGATLRPGPNILIWELPAGTSRSAGRP